MEFIFKSTTSLIFLYILYYILLRNSKTFKFNRFYLLFSLIFSIILPFIHIKTGFNVPLNKTIQDFSASTNGFLLQGNIIDEHHNKIITITNMVLFSYLIVSLILLIRLALNLYRIIRKIKTAETADTSITKVVLVQEKTVPYSFFRHIIVNKTDYENGIIDNELLIHEKLHCRQYHSMDILIIEIIKTLLWFNPMIWLYKKEIQLNHEYLADNEVLVNHNRENYQHILLNLVFRNNSTYLASNFNYSLTKKRLIMMTKDKTRTITYKIALIPVLVALLFYFISCSKKSDNIDNINIDNNTAWWSSILTKHNITPEAYNNFENVFEMGTKNSINNRIVTLENATFIIKTSKDGYIILKSPLAYHDLDKNTIEGDVGTYETFLFKDKDIKPIENFNITKFKFIIGNNKYSLKAEKLISN